MKIHHIAIWTFHLEKLREFYTGIKEQVNTIANRYNKWLYLFHISSC